MSGLREEKKKATRDLLIQTALGLFAERGFDAVTVAEIAEAAGVSEKTVFNYFPLKEDLVLSRRDENERALLETIAGRKKGESILSAVKRHTLALAASMHAFAPERRRAFRRIISGSHTLHNRMFMLSFQYEDALTELIQKESAATSASARVLASMFMGLMRLGYGSRPWSEGQLSTHEETVEAIETAFSLVGKGLASYGIKR